MIDEIREKIHARCYEFSRHAVDQSIIRDIPVADLEEALLAEFEVIEEYPDDKYGPSFASSSALHQQGARCTLSVATRTARL